MKTLFLLLLTITLAGCLTCPAQDPIIVTKTVEVPVEVKCVISYPEEPPSRVLALPNDASVLTKTKAVLQDLEDQRDYSKRLKVIAQKCAEDKKTP